MGTIFYSWQSDTSPKTNRYFLKECIQEAIKNINSNETLDEAIRFDQDSAGVPGMPDIAATIFEKIGACDIFIADLTFTGENDAGRKFPNPNVLIELGYAIGKISDRRIIAIMNTELGSPEDLPFDLKHKRHPINYCLSEDDLGDKQSLKDKKNNLAKELETAIKLIINLKEKPSKEIERQNYNSVSFSDLINQIEISDSRSEWEHVEANSETRYVFKNNVNISISINYEDGIQNSDFITRWANCFPNKKATGYWADIEYGSTIIFRTILISVDGGRAFLPLPREFDENGELIIVLPLDYKIAQIFDYETRSLSNYFSKSGLKLP